jgi:hypothetical protein
VLWSPVASYMSDADWRHVSAVAGVTLSDPRLEGDWPAVVAPLAALSNLRVLDVGMGCDGLPQALLHCLPSFPRLQELSLSGSGASKGAKGAARVTGQDLQQLGVLQGTLTRLELMDLMGVDGPCKAAAQRLSWLGGLLE